MNLQDLGFDLEELEIISYSRDHSANTVDYRLALEYGDGIVTQKILANFIVNSSNSIEFVPSNIEVSPCFNDLNKCKREIKKHLK